jgi:hypothetical protein
MRTYSGVSVNRRLDEWVTRDALDLGAVQQPQRRPGPGRPSAANLLVTSFVPSADIAGSRSSTPERDMVTHVSVIYIKALS